MTYNQIFGANDEACIGQTWYLAFDMIVFLVSPIVIYPFWLAKKGTAHKFFAISKNFIILEDWKVKMLHILGWWCLLLVASIVATVGYIYQNGNSFISTQMLRGVAFVPARKFS